VDAVYARMNPASSDPDKKEPVTLLVSEGIGADVFEFRKVSV
jgi:hypothetical protein